MKTGLRLLIVDDERIEREAVRLFASRSEHAFGAIAEAANGVEAIRAAREFRPDLIVMDIRMPGKTGVAAAEEIRAEDGRTRIVFLTAFGELEYAKAAFKVRADDFLVKPVSERAFAEAVGRALGALAEAGAIARPAEAAPRGAEEALMDAVRRGDAERAEAAADALFAAEAAAVGLQESRRAAALLVELIDRGLRADFGKAFAAGATALDSLPRTRGKNEVRSCLLSAARGFAEAIAAAKSNPQRRVVEEAIAFIARRLHTPLCVEDVCSSVSLSRSHFSRLFRAETGSSFSCYLCAKRLERAKELLADPSIPMKRVCDACGFRDRSYFSSVFKKREGISPSEYRSLAERRRRSALLSIPRAP